MLHKNIIVFGVYVHKILLLLVYFKTQKIPSPTQTPSHQHHIPFFPHSPPQFKRSMVILYYSSSYYIPRHMHKLLVNIIT